MTSPSMASFQVQCLHRAFGRNDHATHVPRKLGHGGGYLETRSLYSLDISGDEKPGYVRKGEAGTYWEIMSLDKLSKTNLDLTGVKVGIQLGTQAKTLAGAA